MAKVGGARPGAGRKPGVVSQAKRDLADKAKEYADFALSVLVDVARNGEVEAARVSASNAILDRGYGRPFQSVQLTGKDEGPVQVIDWSKMSTAALREVVSALSDESTGPDEGGPASD